MAGRRKGWISKSKLGLSTTFALALLLSGYVAILEYSRPHLAGRELRYDQFFNLATEGRVNSATILDADGAIVGIYERADGTSAPFNAPFFRSTNIREPLLNLLLTNGVPIEIDQQIGKSLAQPALVLIPSLVIVVVLIYMILSWRRGSGFFSARNLAKRLSEGDVPVRFGDVAGQDAAVRELSEISQFLENPDRFLSLGASAPKGVLIFGPPGCGKTLLARALAGEAGATFFTISGSDFVEMFVGVGASRVRELFKEARENAPAIIFIDEIDSIGRRRSTGTATGSQDEQEQTLNQILAEMDGFNPSEGLIVIGATNRPDVLDPALLRPGRFDRAVGLERPDESGRVAILEVHARGKPLDPEVDLRALAARGIGLSGADLANIVNEAALLAAREGKRSIGNAEFDEALRRVVEAPEKQRRLSMRSRSLGQRLVGSERVTFADVAGIEEALTELAEVKTYLDDPQRFTRLGARPPRGFLLVGPPGCGKTLLARAVAGETNANFVAVAATEFTEVFVGEGAGRVRDLFAEARSSPPAIVFIDEIDAIGARRGASADGQREREQTLNQILIELDGFGPRDGVMVLAASNRPEILDPALVRPGRFDRTITINLPDRGGRRSILQVHVASKPLAPDVDLDHVAAVTSGFSGADLANVMNEAALLAARRRASDISMRLIDEAIERVGMGVTRAYDLKGDERTAVAYHEAGHAVTSLVLPGADPPGRVSIVPRGQSLGAAWHIVEERKLFTRSAMLDRLAVMLAGRIAEEMVVGEPSTAAAGDLERVGDMARRMVLEYGMSPALGTLSYGEGNGADGTGRQWSPSPETARLVDDEVRKLVAEAAGRARAVLDRHRTGLDRVARALMERETLQADDVSSLVGLAPSPN